MVNPIYVAYHHLPDAPRRTRRTLALLAFIGIPLQYLGYVTLVANGLLSPALWAPISVALFAMTLIGYVGVVGFARGRAEMSADLDERQSQVRDRALALAYGVVTTAVVAVLAAVALYTSFVGPLTVDMTSLTPILIAIGLYLPILPSAVLAWIEPDPPDEVDQGAGR